jgi:deoxycytidylate deaminase
MPKVLNVEESKRIIPHYESALKIALRSDCKEAQFGAVIFHKESVLAEGVNHIAEAFSGKECSLDCPRRRMPQLRGGVGAELCIATHAEEEAVNNFRNLPERPGREIEENSLMVVARLKERRQVLPDTIAYVRCTLCAKKLNETNLAGILFPKSDAGGITFSYFTRKEFAVLSAKNLAEKWIELFPFLAASKP